MATERSTREILAAIKAWRHWSGNDMLDQLGVPNVEGRLRHDERFVRRMPAADVYAEQTLLEFFELGSFAHKDDIWDERGLRLFVSHISDAKTRFLPLAKELSYYGIHSFLAHEAIKPAKNWRQVLLQALGSMDALLSFHSEGFRDSEWCAQEVGYALGRGTNLIAVMDGELPAGFISAMQGIKWNPDAPKRAAEAVVDCLCNEPASALALGDALAHRLKFAGSYDGSDFYVAALERCGNLSENAKRNIELALLLNDQVRGRHGAMALVGQAEEEVA